ncbi:MAG: 3-deoxy-7-phosphoheptulonate synthase [Spirochaetota bacterium]
MIIILKPHVSDEEIDHLIERIESRGLKTNVSKGIERTIIGIIGDEQIVKSMPLDAISCVEEVKPILKPFKRVSREMHPDNTIIKINGSEIGGKKIAIIAGPCAVESKEQTVETAVKVKYGGAGFFRGGAFKPRTSPYDFQGLREKGLEILIQAKKETGLPICTEVMDTRDVELVADSADIIQIGARNVQNFNLLKEVGKTRKPILLKRGMMTRITELLMSAEYIMSEGNPNVILCERGIRTFEDSTRNTLDISAIPVIKELSHLPIVVDPSHASGYRRYVSALAKGAVAAGADGLIIEVHRNPEEALVDGGQSLSPSEFEKLMLELKPICMAIGREL